MAFYNGIIELKLHIMWSTMTEELISSIWEMIMKTNLQICNIKICWFIYFLHLSLHTMCALMCPSDFTKQPFHPSIDMSLSTSLSFLLSTTFSLLFRIICLSVYLSNCLFTYLSTHLYTLFVYQSLPPLYIHTYMSARTIYVYMYVRVHLPFLW